MNDSLAVALFAFALQFAVTSDSFRSLTCLLDRRFLVMTAELHLAEQSLTLHFLFQRAQSLIDVIVAYDDLYDGNHPFLDFS